MPSDARQTFFKHGNNWTAEHEGLIAEPEIWGSLAFQGLILDLEGHLREQRCCPACQSTISGPPTTLTAVLDSLRQHSQVVHLSLQLLVGAPAAIPPSTVPSR